MDISGNDKIKRGKRYIIISEGHMNNFDTFFNQFPTTSVTKGQVRALNQPMPILSKAVLSK